jgi:hypothetical protein
MLCSENKLFSSTVPKISPWERISPYFIDPAWKLHNLLGSSEGTSTPLGTKIDPEYLAMTYNGRWIPSKI